MSLSRLLTVVALAAVAAPASAQHRSTCATAPVYVAPAAVNYAAPYHAPYYPVVRRTVVVQQDYVVEPQVSEVVEILDAKQFRASGLNYGYYGHNGFYPDKVAVVREVVQRQTVVIPAPPQVPAAAK